MATNSNIEWTHHTFNSWRGCTKVSEGCRHCYAETMSKRNLKVLGQWGPNGTRVIAAESYWKEPLKWNKAAQAAGERHRVFCASLADVFEGPETMPEASRDPVKIARARVLDLIADTPHLDWLLLTKRPDGVIDRLREIVGSSTIGGNSDYLASKWIQGDAPANVWLGTSVENKSTLERIWHLSRHDAAVQFISIEPLLEDLGSIRGYLEQLRNGWVIVGGESGPGARPCDVAWIRSIVRQCREVGVKVFVKQLGANIRGYNERCWRCGESDWGAICYPYGQHPRVWNCNICGSDSNRLRDPKGGDWNEWPDDLRVREFPRGGE